MLHHSRIVGVLATYERVPLLDETLVRIFDRTRPLDHLFVIDNESSTRTADLAVPVNYMAVPENFGVAVKAVAGPFPGRMGRRVEPDMDWKR